MIPLLYSYVVTPGYMTASQFVLGLSIQQILPGPNFNFAAFCGGVGLASIMDPLSQNIPSKIAYAIFGAVVGNIAIFIPGLVINLGVLPFHKSFTRNKLFQVLLQGIRAAAIGYLKNKCFYLMY